MKSTNLNTNTPNKLDTLDDSTKMELDEKKDVKKLEAKLSIYAKDPSYVYNTTYNHSLIIMKKLDVTKTDEDRKGIIDDRFALFSADVLKVVDIVEKWGNNNSCDWCTYYDRHNWFNGPYVKILKGNIIITKEYPKLKDSKYINDNYVEVPKNINYFKSIEPAYYETRPCRKQLGYVKEWWETTGAIKSEGCYVVGSKDGLWTEYYENGKRKSKGYYCSFYSDDDGYRTGKWKEWYDNGLPKSEGEYETSCIDRKIVTTKVGKWKYFKNDKRYDNYEPSGTWASIVWNNKQTSKIH